MKTSRIKEIDERWEKMLTGDYAWGKDEEDDIYYIRVIHHLPDGRRCTSFIATCCCGGVDNAANADFFAHAKDDLEFTLNGIEEAVAVLKRAIADQRTVEVMQDMIEWYDDAEKLIQQYEPDYKAKR